MYIDLSWKNLNQVSVELKIYRGDEPLDTSNLEDPVATITNGAETWRDNDVELGKTYYYVFETITENDVSVSKNFAVQALQRRGVGPQDLKQGDFNLGYFGSVPSNQFINNRELCLAITNNAQTQIGSTVFNPYPMWHKFIRKNKVIYVPNRPLSRNGLSWVMLNNLGIAMGERTFELNNFYPTIPEPKKVKIGADEFIVRLMSGVTDEDYATITASGSNFDNEFNDFVFPLGHTPVMHNWNAPSPGNSKLTKINRVNDYIADFFNGTTLTAGCGILVQELFNINNAMHRGSFIAASSEINSDRSSNYLAANYSAHGTANDHVWWPVLELVETSPLDEEPEDTDPEDTDVPEEE